MIRRGLVLAVALALTAPLATTSTTAATTSATNAAVVDAPEPGSSYQVTLVTGDRVRATRDGKGAWSFGFEPGEAGTGNEYDESTGHAQYPTRQGDWYVIPREAARLVGSGALDRELFNITALIRQRYDDARSDTLPLLMEYPDSVATERAAIPAGARVERKLSGRNLAAVDEDKAQAARFWRALTGGAPSTATTLAGGPRKVWLNARFSASLEVSVPQIGAPTAWERGHTGTGVTVAVLDTGADADHPDLTGKITQSQDFTGTGNTQDLHGHGTHVASTIVGTGAASDGRYKGVAPDAQLAVGKVLDDTGNGQVDDILAGMEWAARDVRAKVVNMSLGGYPSDGTDPISRTVDDLTRQHGTLFVIAAGNFGVEESVAAPAAATTALAVGSVTKDGQVSPFSSRGPRLLDGAVKPEIAAPGSDIVAARARDTQLGEPVGEHHVRASGTSMAAPHVAGAAAILAGQHPDWTAERLKAALVGSAAPITDANVFAVGGGRVDLARATTQPVTTTPATINGYLKWPDHNRQQHTVTYRNDGDTPITLALSLELADNTGQTPPTSLATLSTSNITIPAGDTGSVTLTLTPRSGRPGIYGGLLTASDGGTTRLRTPISVHDEEEKHDLTVNLIDRDGNVPAPGRGDTGVIGLDTGDWYTQVPNGERLRLPAGRYAIVSLIQTPRGNLYPSWSTMAHPELRLSRNETLTLDARTARQVTVDTGQQAARGGYWTMRYQARPSGQDFPYTHLFTGDPRFSQFYAWSAPGVSSAAFGYANNLRIEEPLVELFAEQPERFELHANWLLPSPTPLGIVGKAAVHGGAGRPEDLAGLDVRDKLVVIDLPGSTSRQEALERVRNVTDVGGALVVINAVSGGALATAGARPSADNPDLVPTLVVDEAPGQRFSDQARAGGAQASLTTRLASAHRYELSFPSEGHVPDGLDYVVRPADLAEVRMAYHGYPPDSPPASAAYVQALGREIGTQRTVPVPAQQERVEYFTPGMWRLPLAQQFESDNRVFLSTVSESIRLEAGRSYRIGWNAAVNGPGFAGTVSDGAGANRPWVCRLGDTLHASLPLFSDAAGHSRTANFQRILDTGSTRMYRDGELTGSTDLPGNGAFAASAEPAEYRLTAEVTRNHPHWPTSTNVSGSWTFRSEHRPEPQCQALPLLAVRFAPLVDLRNAAPGGGEFSFPVTVPRQDGGPVEITSLEVEVSYDDGATWQPATVRPDGGAWRATVTHPATGFASLRARAADTDGNTVEQTITRAYQIAP